MTAADQQREWEDRFDRETARIDALSPQQMRHALIFLAGFDPDALWKAVTYVEREHAS